MSRESDGEKPTLGEVWNMLGERLGLDVEVRDERSITARGTVRGRAVMVEIEGSGGRREFARFLFGINTISSRNRREKWRCTLSIGCTNPGETGTLESAVDVRDPAWNPREYDPRNGRKITTDPPALADRVLTEATREALMNIMDDVRIRVERTELRLEDESMAIPGKAPNYVAGCLVHHYTGSPQPWPERGLAGPTWWIDLMCDLADTLERRP